MPRIPIHLIPPASILGQGYANLTSSGELVLVGFQESMSGAYKCALSHRIIETSAQKEVDVTNTYRFMVYGKISPCGSLGLWQACGFQSLVNGEGANVLSLHIFIHPKIK